MKISKKLCVILASSAAGVVVAGSTTAGIITNSPKNVMSNAIGGFFEDFTKRDEIEPIYNMLQKGSLSFYLSEIKQAEENLIAGQEYSGTMYFSKDAFAIEDLNINTGDFHIAGDVYLTNDLLYINETELFDFECGISTKDMIWDFEHSIFAYGENSEYAIEDNTLYDAIIDALECCKTDKMQKDAQKLVKSYAKKAWNIVRKNASFNSQTKKVKLNGKRTSARVVTMDIDGDALSAIIDDLYDFLESDNKMTKFLEKYEAYFSLPLIYSETPSIVDAYEDWLDILGQNLDDICETVEEHYVGTQLEVVTPKLSSKLLKCTLRQGGDEIFELDCGSKGIKNSNHIQLTYDGEEIVYEVKKDNKSHFKAVLSYGGDDLSIEINRKKDTYKLQFATVTLKGDFIQKGKTSTITLDQISQEGNPLEATTDLKIVIREKDKMPSAPKDYDILPDIKDKDINEWIEALQGTSLPDIYGLLG